MSRIYTRTGDAGQTGLLGGLRAPKTEQRFEALGALDEVNAHLGLAVASAFDEDVSQMLRTIQGDLLAIGAALAQPDPAPANPIAPDRIGALEDAIDTWQAEAPPLIAFILPGGTPGSAALHVARAVSRRAERNVIRLHQDHPVAPEVIAYLNRLSDLLFAAARVVAHRAGTAETKWRGQA